MASTWKLTLILCHFSTYQRQEVGVIGRSNCCSIYTVIPQLHSSVENFGHTVQAVPELADQTYSAFSLVITESNSV
jgi:hypothetical protein